MVVIIFQMGAKLCQRWLDCGFLKYKCRPERTMIMNNLRLGKYGCHNTRNEFYHIFQCSFFLSKTVYKGHVCSNDWHYSYYQACDRRTECYKVTDSNKLCENWLCREKVIA